MNDALPSNKIDQATIDRANADIVGVIGSYIKLKREGSEYTACCPFHQERSPSFKVTPAKNFYYCFGCGAGGDAVGFVMDYQGIEFPDAVRTIVGNLPDPSQAIDTRGKKAVEQVIWQPIRKVPADAPEPTFSHWRLGDKPAAVWPYLEADGSLIGYVVRYNTTKADGTTGKETVPLCWAVNTKTGEFDWRWLSFGVPRPLYGLDRLAAKPDAKVLVVEGEKTADAAQKIFTGFVVVSWPGGGKAVGHADWTPLADRNVTLWPDWDWKQYPEKHAHEGQLMPVIDQPGVDAMHRLFRDHLREIAASVRIVPPMEGTPDGWDLADAAPEGFSPISHAKQEVCEASQWFAEKVDSVEALHNQQKSTPANDNQQPASDRFGQPIDIFGITMPPQLPIELLPEPIQDYVLDQAELTGCDHTILGMTTLVAAAACIDDGIRLQPKRMDPTWTESARLWVAIVGDPSTKKSPAISKSVKAVRSIDGKMLKEYNSAMADYTLQLEKFKDDKKAKKADLQKPEEPKRQRLIVEDITVEALSEVLKDNSRGVLCLQDELTGWFAGMDAYKGSNKGASRDRAHWLEAYNGGHRAIDRVTRGSLFVPNWSACMIGGIQPDMIRRVASSMGNDGLLQRFMVIVARSATRDADRLPNMQAMDEFKRLFDHLANTAPSADVVKMEEAAHQARERISELAMRMVRAFDHQHITAMLGKWDGLFARLTLLYHVIECAGNSVYPTTVLVSGATAEKVERLMCGVLLPHAIHFYTEIMDAHSKQENLRHAARMILARGLKRVTKRDLTLYWKASRALPDWELRETMTSLCNVGWLAANPATIDIDGKPTSWDVNPAVHDAFADYADKERKRRNEAVETLRKIKAAYQDQ